MEKGFLTEDTNRGIKQIHQPGKKGAGHVFEHGCIITKRRFFSKDLMAAEALAAWRDSEIVRLCSLKTLRIMRQLNPAFVLKAYGRR